MSICYYSVHFILVIRSHKICHYREMYNAITCSLKLLIGSSTCWPFKISSLFHKWSARELGELGDNNKISVLFFKNNSQKLDYWSDIFYPFSTRSKNQAMIFSVSRTYFIAISSWFTRDPHIWAAKQLQLFDQYLYLNHLQFLTTEVGSVFSKKKWRSRRSWQPLAQR